jgi:aureolysin
MDKPYPNHMNKAFPISNTCDRSNDNCWVHVNSTIPGHASYLVTQAIGKEKAQKLYYLALTQYLGATSKFKDAALALRKSCAQLLESADCSLVSRSLMAVGL